jgi:plastocyanin domain-containing protein
MGWVMDSAQIVVTVTGLLLMAAVAWFFFGEREKALARVTEGGVQVLRVTVKGGYSPDTLVVKRGQPVRIEFDRQETSSCSDTVVFGDFGISRPLPAFRTTPVEFTPEKAGSYEFTCGMNMLRGRLIVEDQ